MNKKLYFCNAPAQPVKITGYQKYISIFHSPKVTKNQFEVKQVGQFGVKLTHMLEFANEQPFGRAMALLHTALPAVNMSSSQSQLLTQHIGSLSALEELLTLPGFDFEQQENNQLEEPISEDVLYVQVDGGHLRTDEGSLGDIFFSFPASLIAVYSL